MTCYSVITLPLFVLLAQITYINYVYMPLVAVLSSYIYFFVIYCLGEGKVIHGTNTTY